jgi:hypothetical protein
MEGSRLGLAIEAALEERLAGLRAEPFAVLAQLAESTAEDARVHGKRVRFTTLCIQEPDGSLIIFVRSDRKMAGGLLRAGSTQGFQITPSGLRRTLTASEILDFFG